MIFKFFELFRLRFDPPPPPTTTCKGPGSLSPRFFTHLHPLGADAEGSVSLRQRLLLSGTFQCNFSCWFRSERLGGALSDVGACRRSKHD